MTGFRIQALRRLAFVAALGTLLLTAPAVSAAGQNAPGSPLPPLAFQPYNEAQPVLAYYYAWWDPDNFSKTLYQPARSYNSDEPVIMREHITQAQRAGIDGFVMSWYGMGDRTDKNLKKLLEYGRESGFRTTIHFETPLFSEYGVEDVVAQLQGFYANYLNDPALVTYQGRPVIFFWWVQVYDNAQWAEIRNRVDPERRAVWLADGDNFNVLASDAWEGISPYNSAWSATPTASLAGWKAKAQAVAPEKLFVPVAQPGHDDTAARPTSFIRERDNGAYYQASLSGVLSVQPQWGFIINSFNEWMEATQIEPSVQYGDTYLTITRTYSEAFKNSSGLGFQPVEPEPAPEELPAE